MTCWFFMSYARLDGKHRETEYVRTFYEDLKNEVSSKVQDQSSPIAFLDEANLRPGDPWSDEITLAVRTCRTFIPIMTARYFTREYCGKEWTIFADRCATTAINDDGPNLIIPVLWDKPEEGEFPDYATKLQITFDPRNEHEEDRDKLVDYGKSGLLYVIKRKGTTHSNAYETILEQLARHIIRLAIEHELSPLEETDLPSLGDVASQFSEEIPPPQSSPDFTSDEVHFAILAGKQEEMQGVRDGPDSHYGPANGRQWMPFIPETDRIGLIAQSVATDQKLMCEWTTVDYQIVTRLRQIEKQNLVAILIVDPWAARLPIYAHILTKLDEVSFRNCVVLVVWNPKDPQTQTERDRLHDDLQRAMFRRFAAQNHNFLKRKIEKHSQLKTEIAMSLDFLEGLLAPRREPTRPTGASEHAETPSI